MWVSCRSFARLNAVRNTCWKGPARFRSNLVEIEGDQNVGATGYDAVMQRAANILLCNADPQQFVKVLHVFPEGPLTKFLAKAKNFEIVGLSDQKEGLHTYASYYSSIERAERPFASADQTGLRVDSFEAVASCVPFDPAFLSELSPTNSKPASANNVGALGVESLLYVLNSRGYLVLGAPSDQFARLQWKEYLTQLSQEGGGTLVAFMKLMIPVHELLEEMDAKKNGELETADGESTPDKKPASSGVSASSKIPSVFYSLACFRKA